MAGDLVMDRHALIRRFAEIEYGKGWLDSMLADKDLQRHKWKFDPFTDIELLWGLVIKYEMDIVQSFKQNYVQIVKENPQEANKGKVWKVPFNCEHDIPRAILECIILSKESNNE